MKPVQSTWLSALRQWSYGLLIVVVWLSPALVQSQDRQFTFDASGHLFSESPASASLPQILAPPQPLVVLPGALASFLVVAADTSGLSYQWRFNDTNISSATNDALLLTNVTVVNQGLYSVVLVNSSGSVTSAPAALMIDSDGDGIADAWETTYFTNLNQNALADFDNDGISNRDEFLDGTNPTNSASAFFRLSIFSDGGQVTLEPLKLKYTNGELVTVTATPYTNELFHGWTGDVLSTSNQLVVTMSRNRSLVANFSYYTLVFTNTANSDWHTAINWSPNLVPAMGDTVFVMLNGASVTANSTAECGSLMLGGGGTPAAVGGSGTLTVHSNGVWSSGDMTGSGRTIIGSNATFTINNIASTVFLNTRTLENAGKILWTGADAFNLQCGGAVITNRAGALFEVRNNASFGPFPGNSRFDNAGTFRKTAGSGTTTFAVNNSFVTAFYFNNYGTVDLQTGTLLCNATYVNNGALTVSSGATMRMAAGGSGDGTFTNASGGLVDWTGSTSTFTVSSGALLSGSGLYKISGGTVVFNTDLAVQNLDVLATLDGSGTLTVNNVLNWPSGTMSGSGRTIIAPGATNYINNVSTVFLGSRTLENAGTILWTGADNFSLQCGGAVITNRPGALFEVRNNASFGPFPGNSRFDNAGTFRKTTGTGTTTFAANNSFVTAFYFNNYGVTELQTGTLLCNAACVNSGTLTLSPGTTLRMAAGGSATGIYTNPPGSLVEWAGNSSTFTVSSGVLLSGSGLYKISGGTVVLNADLTVQNLDVLATLDGSGALTVNNVLNWPSGSMTGSGRTIIAPGATNYITNVSTVFLGTRTLDNAGTILWTGVDGASIQCSGAVITNRPGALFEVRNNSSLGAFPGNSRFDNVGIFRKTTGSGTTTFAVNNSFGTAFPFNNYGTVDIRKGIIAALGGCSFGGGALLKCALGGTNAGSGFGQLQVSGTVTLNGGLSVDFLPGFTPAINEAFPLVFAGTRNGAFTSFVYPSNLVAMQLTNTTTSAIVRVTDITLTNGPPFIVGDLPVSQFVYDGRMLTLPARVAGGAPFTFQWQKDGTSLTNNAHIAGTTTDTLYITNALRAFDSGNYRLLITNSEGSATSRLSTVSIQAVPKFNANGVGWSLQGTTVPPMNTNNTTLTSALFNTGRSVFYNARLYIGAFTAQFVYVDVGGGGADGITFCIQNDARGAATLGGGGGGIGYAGISPSAALALNIYQPNTRGMSWRTNGSLPFPNPYNPTGPVNLASGNPIHVSLLYTGGVLRATFVESNTANTFTTNLAVNIPAMVGAETAYVGFTGGDGGVGSTQIVSNFTFVPITRVLAEQTAPETIALSWPAVIGGYTAQTAANLISNSNVWQDVTNVVNQVNGRNQLAIPATVKQEFYRLRIGLNE
jgi:hypothetical protein